MCLKVITQRLRVVHVRPLDQLVAKCKHFNEMTQQVAISFSP